jgi:hypothetical protein
LVVEVRSKAALAMTTISCQACRTDFLVSHGGNPGAITRCPSCGASGLVVHIEVDDELAVAVHELVNVKKRVGARSPTEEIRTGDSFWRDQQRWIHLYRRIDRANDWYEEIVWDPETATVVHRCTEQLSKHRGADGAQRNRS